MVAALLVGPVFGYLLTSAPDEVTMALADDTPGVPTEARGVLSSNHGVTTRRVPVWRVGPIDLRPVSSIDLLVATRGTSPQLLSGALRLGTCNFQLQQPLTLGDGSFLRLVRTGQCSDQDSSEGELVVSVKGRGALLLWSSQAPSGSDATQVGLSLTQPSVAGPRWMLRGRIRAAGSGRSMRRLAMAAWLWDMSVGEVAAIFGLAFALAASGTWLLSGTWSDSSAFTMRMGVGSAGLALAVAVLWSVTMPPLQSADSIDHLMSFGEVSHQSSIESGIDIFARRVHFERIRMRAYEFFQPSSLTTPINQAWTDDIHAERMETRSPVTSAFWRLIAPAVESPSLAVTLQRLQLFNALLFAGVVGVAAAVLARHGPGRNAWLMGGLLLIPTLPYSATMLSDWALLTTWSVLAAVACLLAVTATTGAGTAGLLLGLSVGLLLGTGLSGLSVMPVAVGASAVVVLFDTRNDRRGRLWLGLTIALLLWPVLLDSLLDVGFQRNDARRRTEFAAMLSLVNWLLGSFAAHPLALVGIPAGLALVDRLWRPVRLNPRYQSVAARVAFGTALLVVLTAVIQLAWSTAVSLPKLQTFESYSFDSTWEYVGAALLAGLTAARVDGFDHLTYSSLWGGFGWVDAILPEPMLAFVALALVAGLVAVVTCASNTLRILAIASLGTGTVGFAALSVASALMHRNLHGRYLLPLAVSVTVLVMAPAGAWIDSSRLRAVRWIVALLAAGLHGASLYVVAARYYGPL